MTSCERWTDAARQHTDTETTCTHARYVDAFSCRARSLASPANEVLFVAACQNHTPIAFSVSRHATATTMPTLTNTTQTKRRMRSHLGSRDSRRVCLSRPNDVVWSRSRNRSSFVSSHGRRRPDVARLSSIVARCACARTSCAFVQTNADGQIISIKS